MALARGWLSQPKRPGIVEELSVLAAEACNRGADSAE
jgi:hypothetical protein